MIILEDAYFFEEDTSWLMIKFNNQWHTTALFKKEEKWEICGSFIKVNGEKASLRYQDSFYPTNEERKSVLSQIKEMPKTRLIMLLY